MSAVFDSSDDKWYCKIDILNRDGMVVWEDVNHDMQHTSDLSMDFHVDTSEQHGLFILHGLVYFKVGAAVKTNSRLFIYPENIQSIEHEVSSRPSMPGMEESSNKFIRLRFTMTQPPSFVVPNNQPLEPKPKSKAVLDSLKSLATVHSFTIYLELLRLSLETRHQLSLLPSVFSSTNISSRLRTDVKRANLPTLYKGAGGQVLDLGVAHAEPGAGPSNDIVEQLVQQTIEEMVAPAYTKDGSLQSPAQVITPSDRKRRRTSESTSPPTTDKRVLTALAQLAKSHADLQSRFEHLEKSHADLQSRFEHLEKMVADSRCDHTSSIDRNGKHPRLATPSDLDLPSLPPTPTAPRKRTTSTSGFLPPYLDRQDERVIASPSNHRFE
ncbi:hypothetical protein QBC32DRAFT_75734 [Pseudoneurospora amorphoporcata]|uniref:Uncharacterized protein n=1 Tax=Pseudoneurospora amorphoporcata TaxID=241081 RepID=A0AAN6NKZ0_9PEZI|nr:hypothetical protein QBC32DRAFT_75734 [Pseudoneurospora amorphoporcata]